jgi:hypothetical protein
MIACKLCIMKKGLKGTDRPQNCDYVFFNEKDLEKHLLDVHNVYTVKQ